MFDNNIMVAPRKLQSTEKITGHQQKILRTHFNLKGKKLTQDRLKELRDEYNKELPNIKKQYQEQIKKEQEKKDLRNTKKKVKNVMNVRPKEYNAVYIFKNPLKQFRGKRTHVIAVVNEEVIFDLQLDIPTKKYGKWWDSHYNSFMKDSDETLIHNHMKNENTQNLQDDLRASILDSRESGVNFNLKDFDYSRYYKEGNVKVIFSTAKDIDAQKVAQIYREGVKNCMLLPISEWIEDKLLNAKGESTIRRYRRYNKLIQEDMKKYSEGVPQDDIQDISNKYQIDIHLDLPLQIDKYLVCKSFKKPLRTFKYVNTRLNHLDLNEVVSEEYEEVSRDNINSLVEQYNQDGTYYDYNKDAKNRITKLRTLNNRFQVVDKYAESVNAFEKESGLDMCKIDAIEDELLYWFISSGTHANLTIDFSYERDGLKNIDMEKAFTQFWRSPNYKGFVGKITDFRKCNKIMGVGYYRVVEFKNLPSWLVKLNSYIGGNVYPSVEIEYLNSLGVETIINEGCYGLTTDFRFPQEMYTKEDGVSFYSKWTGIQEQYSTTKSFYMKGDKEYFENMKAHTDTRIMYFDEEKEGLIIYPKNHHFNLIHIAGFIKAYARMILYEQLQNMDIDKVVRIASDGIYFKEHDINLIKPFRYEDKMKFGNSGASSYLSGIFGTIEDDDEMMESVDFSEPICDSEERTHYKRELFLGAGGNGKTHHNLIDKGFVRMLYIAPSWKLSTNKKLKYNVSNSVLARCLSDAHNQDLKKYYNVILFDEVSQYTEGEKNMIFETFNQHKLIFCGDVGFQLPPIEGEEMNTEGFDNTETFTTNYRFKCPKQIEICNKVRDMIKIGFDKNTINKYIIKSYTNISKDDMNYVKEDMILCSKVRCGTHNKESCNCDGKNYSKEWTDKYGMNKWVCDENTREHNRGEIMLGDKPNGRWINRHGYTIHSVQGETFTETIFIDSRNLFDSRMGYTAISRAEKWEQIKIIV